MEWRFTPIRLFKSALQASFFLLPLCTSAISHCLYAPRSAEDESFHLIVHLCALCEVVALSITHGWALAGQVVLTRKMSGELFLKTGTRQQQRWCHSSVPQICLSQISQMLVSRSFFNRHATQEGECQLRGSIFRKDLIVTRSYSSEFTRIYLLINLCARVRLYAK